jgi:hypothetical protein
VVKARQIKLELVGAFWTNYSKEEGRNTARRGGGSLVFLCFSRGPLEEKQRRQGASFRRLVLSVF